MSPPAVILITPPSPTVIELGIKLLPIVMSPAFPRISLRAFKLPATERVLGVLMVIELPMRLLKLPSTPLIRIGPLVAVRLIGPPLIFTVCVTPLKLPKTLDVAVLIKPKVKLAPEIVTLLASARMVSLASMENKPILLPSASAVKRIEPPGPGAKVNLLSRKLLMIISLVASRSTFAPAARHSRVVSEIVKVSPGRSSNRI